MSISRHSELGSEISPTAPSMVGFYHEKNARKLRDEGTEAIQRQHREAAEAYMEAASCYPEDDEKHPCELSLTLEAQIRS